MNQISTNQSLSTSSIPEIRSNLVSHLAKFLKNDEIAAEFLLLALISRIHTRRGPITLGTFSLNLSNFSTEEDQTPTRVLSSALSEILPSLIQQSLSLSHLNDVKTQFSPKSNGEFLTSGRFQLPIGSNVLIDETQMGEGQLKENGIQNLKTLSEILTTNKLSYRFPFSSFDFESDLNFLVISNGKSLLTCAIHLPILESNSKEKQIGKEITEKDLKSFRHLLLEAKYKNFTIPEKVSEFIQNQFVDSRKNKSTGGNETGQEDLLRQMSIAR